MGAARGLLFILLLRASLCSLDGCGTVFGEEGVQGPPGKAGAPGTVDYEKVREMIADEQKRAIQEKLVELESQKFSVLPEENKELRVELDQVKARLETLTKLQTIPEKFVELSQKFSVLSEENKELRSELDAVKARLETLIRPQNLNECTAGVDNCNANAACINTLGSFRCECNAGYTGDGVSCVDIDECSAGTDDCDGNAACTNTLGSFTCTCNNGLIGNGKTCSDLNECTAGADNCNVNATCINYVGSFRCECNAGYAGDGVTCADLNECTAGVDNCNANAACINTVGSFRCECDAGYTGDGVTCAAKYTGPCEIYYSGKCFFWITSRWLNFNYAEAEIECSKRGLRVADIYDQDHFEIVANKTREKIPYNWGGYFVWTAMTYNETDHVVSLSNGDMAPSFKWRLNDIYTRIGLVIMESPDEKRDGMWNKNPISRGNGVVCEQQ